MFKHSCDESNTIAAEGCQSHCCNPALTQNVDVTDLTALDICLPQITATCIRVPIMRAHAESINLEFERDISEEEAVDVLSKAAGVSMINDRSANRCGIMISNVVVNVGHMVHR